MSITDLLLLLLLPLTVVVSALCAASETALFSLTYSDRARLTRISPRAGAAIGRLFSRPRGFLLAILLLTNLANVTYFVASSVLQQRIPGQALSLVVNLATLLALILFADLLPKLLARSRRIEFCRLAAPSLVWVLRVLGPVTAVLEHYVVEPLMRLVRPRTSDPQAAVTTEELAALLDLSARAGDIQADEQRLLGDVVELGTTRVRDVMTPRIAMPWLPESAAIPQVLDAIRTTGALRIPVFRGSLDGRPVGMLDVKRFLPALELGQVPQSGKTRLAPYLVPPLFIPERARLDQLLEFFRTRREITALCVDERGGVEGIVEIGDVLDELVSPGADAGAEPGEGVVRLGPDSWLLPGRLSVRELSEYFFGPTVAGRGPALDRRASTVGGLIFARLGRMPRVGDSIRVGNVNLTVHTMSGRAVGQVAASVAGPEVRP